jgi:hypothetical protein
MISVASVESAYEHLAHYVLDFIESRNWDEAGCKAEVTSHSVGLRDTWLSSSNVVDNKALGWGNSEISSNAMQAIRYLQQEMLRTTGHRIWGLTFTLFPNGKFKLAYDYDKPEGYEEAEEPVNLQEALTRLQDMGVKIEGPSS